MTKEIILKFNQNNPYPSDTNFKKISTTRVNRGGTTYEKIDHTHNLSSVNRTLKIILALVFTIFTAFFALGTPYVRNLWKEGFNGKEDISVLIPGSTSRLDPSPQRNTSGVFNSSTAMNIAVIGFGSLINQPSSPVYHANLSVEKPSQGQSFGYHIKPDSPFVVADNLKLPIRMGRISNAGTDKRRITLVLDHKGSDEPVFYAQSKCNNLNDAIKNLREREGISNSKHIGYVNLKSGKSRSRIPEVAAKISEFARNKGFQAVIWTDLPCKGVEFQSQSTGREILPLLANDPVLLKNTKEYINILPYRTPLQENILRM